MFTREDYDRLHALVFRPDYSGYKPSVVEIPNGDGKADTEKRYAHVALKYMTDDWQRAALMPYLERAHEVARQAMVEADDEMLYRYYPDIRYGALRVLEYPPGAVSNKHCDFDLFTLMCYRDQPLKFVSHDLPARFLQTSDGHESPITRIRALNPQAHLGELGSVIGLGPATPHEVIASDTVQRSIVYFAIPDHDSVLPNGMTVRDWLNARMVRSRTEFKAYE